MITKLGQWNELTKHYEALSKARRELLFLLERAGKDPIESNDVFLLDKEMREVNEQLLAINL